MQARSALFDLYGDHLPSHDHQAPVAAIVRLLAPVGIAAPAVRTAISRMVGQGWLTPVSLPAGRGYRATTQAIERLAEAGDRVYRRNQAPWDGSWQLAFIDPPGHRSARARLRADLAYLGYAELSENVWISPTSRRELASVVARNDATVRIARAAHFDPPPTDAWDLDALREEYADWLAHVAELLSPPLEEEIDADERAFACRFRLVHEWRKFLFADPGLPEHLLPTDWPGRQAVEVFTHEATRLKPASDRFLQRCLVA